MQALCKGIVKDVENGRIIEIVQEKTGEKVSIPLLPIAEKILTKYNYNLPQIADTIANKELKEIGKLAQIDRQHIRREDKGKEGVQTETYNAYELIGTHTARRSYISNMLKRGYDSHIIMKITGHKTDEAFRKYARLTSDDAANTILKKVAEIPTRKAVAFTQKETKKKSGMLEYCLAANTILNLIELQQQGINIYQLPELSKVVTTIKNIQRLEEVKETFISKFNESKDKESILQNINQVDKFIWNVGKNKADPELYQMLQHKLLSLGLSDYPIIATDILERAWQQELLEEEMKGL